MNKLKFESRIYDEHARWIADVLSKILKIVFYHMQKNICHKILYRKMMFQHIFLWRKDFYALK